MLTMSNAGIKCCISSDSLTTPIYNDPYLVIFSLGTSGLEPIIKIYEPIVDLSVVHGKK